MLTNKQIQRKAIYRTQQEIIRANKILKDTQIDLILSLNEMIAGYYIENAGKLKQAVLNKKFGKALDRYTKAYCRKIELDTYLHQLVYNLDKMEDK